MYYICFCIMQINMFFMTWLVLCGQRVDLRRKVYFQIHDANRDRLACCVIGWQHSPHDTADIHGKDGSGYNPSP